MQGDTALKLYNHTQTLYSPRPDEQSPPASCCDFLSTLHKTSHLPLYFLRKCCDYPPFPTPRECHSSGG